MASDSGGRFHREPARVLMHLNGGFTRVVLERTEGVGMADGGVQWEVPTRVIPESLRAIGSRFTIVVPTLVGEPGVEELREARDQIIIEVP